jgi:hypothetical protein
MKLFFPDSFQLNIKILLLLVFSMIQLSTSFVHIELKKSTAKYKSEYLKSLKFFQKNNFKELSSFLEQKEITLHQQV